MGDDIVQRLNVEIEAESWGLLVDARNEIERLRNLLDAVVEEFNPSCHCDHYPRHDCPCARVRRMLDGLGLPSTNHPEEARREQ